VLLLRAKLRLASMLLPAAILAASCGAAVAFDMAQAISARSAHFKVMGRAAKAVQDELKSQSPNPVIVHAQAQVVAEIAQQLPTWFPRGSGPESGVKTDAKPEIWSQPAKFQQAAATFADRARQFEALSAQGVGLQTRAAAVQLGLTCKACHDEFRVPR
jgi:cytochrome c556